MEKEEFSQYRHYLGKTQNELARLLCVSPKAIQSFEQGWRKIPASAERQLLFLLSLKKGMDRVLSPCWEIMNCPIEHREKCSAWELQAGDYCWFINGTYCQGKMQDSWNKKIQICRTCEVYKAIFPATEIQV